MTCALQEASFSIFRHRLGLGQNNCRMLLKWLLLYDYLHLKLQAARSSWGCFINLTLGCKTSGGAPRGVRTASLSSDHFGQPSHNERTVGKQTHNERHPADYERKASAAKLASHLTITAQKGSIRSIISQPSHNAGHPAAPK